MEDWIGVVSNFRHLLGNIGPTLQQMFEPQPCPEKGITGAQELFHWGLSSLIRFRIHEHGKNFNRIMYNMETLVFCLWWFQQVGVPSRLSIPSC